MSGGRARASAQEREGDELMCGGKWAEACAALSEASCALQLYEEPLAKSRVEAKIGRCHVELRQYGEALERFEKQLARALECTDAEERAEGEAVSRHNLGAARFFLGDHDRALVELETASELLETLDLPAQTARTEALRGVIFHLRKEYDNALKHHKRDAKASARAGEDGVRARINTGAALLGKGDREAAREILESCVDEGGENPALARALYLAAMTAPREDARARGDLERAARIFPAHPADGEELSSDVSCGPADTLVASLVYSALARRELVRNNESLDDATRALGCAEAARLHAEAAQARLGDNATSVFALVAALTALGCGHAVQGNLETAAADFAACRAALADADRVVGDANGSIGIVLPDTRAAVVRTWRCAALRNQAIVMRAGTGLGPFRAGAATPSPEALRHAVELLTLAAELSANDDAADATIHGHRGCCRQLLGLRKEAMADFEHQKCAASNVPGLEGLQLQMDALRNIVDASDARGDLKTALRHAKDHLHLAQKSNTPSAVADAAKRVVAIYCKIGRQFDDDDDDDDDHQRRTAVESVSISKLESMHPRELANREEDIRWVAHNAKVLARWYLQQYTRHARVFTLQPAEVSSDNGATDPGRERVPSAADSLISGISGMPEGGNVVADDADADDDDDDDDDATSLDPRLTTEAKDQLS